MKIIDNPVALQQELLTLKKKGKSIGFVPTMGNLHAGHLSLVQLIKKQSDIVVCSIFVNPAQFGENEDLASYPRTLSEDIQKLEALGIDYLFTPTDNQIYPHGKNKHSSVELNRLTEHLCGSSRPDHFKGVTTVVCILFNIVQPDVAAFGKKDYQQYQVIKAMTRDLMMPIKIIGGEIVRESNGLAMSSRNTYLSKAEKEKASTLRQTILSTAEQIKSGTSLEKTIENAINNLKRHGFKIDYFKVVRQNDLQEAQQTDKSLLIACAAWLGQPRLIDNLELNLN